MIFNILILVIFVIWIIVYMKNKKTILTFPYLFMIFIIPLYGILDGRTFVEIFGDGYGQIVQTNMFNIHFNAKTLVYSFLAAMMAILGLVLAKKYEFENSKKMIYVATIFVVNILLGCEICNLYMIIKGAFYYV